MPGKVGFELVTDGIQFYVFAMKLNRRGGRAVGVIK